LTYWIGVDEAGYGPNLGPLVVAATCWRVDTGLNTSDAVDFYTLLEKSVSSSIAADRLAIADSKLVFKGGQGLRHLEEAVLATSFASTAKLPCWNEPAGTEQATCVPLAPWYQQAAATFPLVSSPTEIESKRDQLQRDCLGQGIELCDVRTAFVPAARFNQLLAKWGNKSNVLTAVTMRLVREVVERCRELGGQPIRVVCDKHGGRNRYVAALQHAFPESHWTIECESRAESRYRGFDSTMPMQVAFRAKGEGFLPAALASITAKYHREVAMLAFNQFWQSRLPNIRSTAGYPVDAKRFVAEIENVRATLKIDRDILWRRK